MEQLHVGKAFDSMQMDYDKSLYDEEVNMDHEKNAGSADILNRRINLTESNIKNEWLNNNSGAGKESKPFDDEDDNYNNYSD